MNAENADFFLFIRENQRFSASKKKFCMVEKSKQGLHACKRLLKTTQ
jgi:hypothetical protein